MATSLQSSSTTFSSGQLRSEQLGAVSSCTARQFVCHLSVHTPETGLQDDGVRAAG
ncbi:GM14325 [Drosophila sechellia]|uniref:GM14325 n=1 Tax=Drosophila sechellia TaxID=7238 RepID=B4HXQ9_DROSE|nr:GM14325 [Drosophila sechellia]